MKPVIGSKLNLFYEEPEPDRWFPYDRYPRRLARRILRGKPQPGGQKLVFLNLRMGLDRLEVPYRINDYRYAQSHPEELVCIIGKPFVLDRIKWRNPILFGAAIFSHPVDDPHLLHRLPVRKVLVPGDWMKRMCKPYYGDKVESWPVGIDIDRWRPDSQTPKCFDIVLYDKVRWNHSVYETSLLEPVRGELRRKGLTAIEIRYGHYRQEEFWEVLQKSRAMLFFCEHESQGIAYQQALASGVPIFAWDQGGFWKDPTYFPHKVQFQPVTSVPYWDSRCGIKFSDLDTFVGKFGEFWDGVESRRFCPREYVIENLTLERCARRYVEFAREVDEY